MARLLIDGAVRKLQVARDIARRNRKTVRDGNENVRQVTADTTLACKRLCGIHRCVGQREVVSHLAVEAFQQRVQAGDVGAAVSAADLLGEFRDCGVGLRQRVSRRNRLGGNRSTVPRTTPSVLCVSTTPSTATLNWRNGPWL